MLDNLIKTVAVYLRISRENGEDADTLSLHRSQLKRLVEERKYTASFYEEIISGASHINERKQLNQMLADINAGIFDAVVVVDITRLSRDEEYSHRIAKVLRLNNCMIITPTKMIDLNNESDRLVYSMESMFSSHELSKITKRMVQGKHERVRKGEWIQGKPPLGYKRGNDKKLAIIESEARLVQQIFNYAESGYGISSIVSKLTGHKTRTGKAYTLTAVNTILKNETYTGSIIYNVKDKKGKITETITTRNAHEPIISKEQFYAVLQALRGRISGDLEVRNRSSGKVLSILKDLVYCNECGLKMGLRKDSKQANTIYLKACKCGNKGLVEQKLLDTFISEFQLIKAFYRDEWEKALNTPQDVSKDSLVKSISEMNKTAEKLKKRLEGYIEMRADGELTRELYQKKKTETETELKRLFDAKDDLQDQLQSFDKEAITSQYEAKMEKIDRFFYLYNMEASQEDIAECNRILKLLINKVRYVRGDSESVITSPLERYEASQGIQQDFVELHIDPK